MSGYLITQGLYDDMRTMVTQGILATEAEFTREDYYGERFHLLPYHHAGPEEIRVEDELAAGESSLLRVRGAGQFGVFLGALSDQTNWRLRVYTDNDRETLLAEFTG